MEIIRLKPFHTFHIDDLFFVIRTRTLFYDIIDEDDYIWLKEREGVFQTEIAPDEKEMLIRLRLIASPSDPTDSLEYLEIDKKAWNTGRPYLLQLRALELMVTQECNMACIYCYGKEGRYGEGGYMTSETARKAVDWYLSQSPDTEEISIGFFGGEPLLNFRLIREVVSYVKEKAPGKKYLFGMTTNATLLNDEIIDFLKNEGITPLISFDGTPEYQRHNRILKNGHDSHDTVIKNVIRLMEKIPQLPACATLWGDADEELVLQTLKQYGFTYFWANRARPSLLDLPELNQGQETRMPENGADPTQFSPEEEAIQSQTFISLKGKVKKTLEALKVRDSEALRDLVRPRDISRMISGWQTHLKYQYCGVGRSMLTVAVDGKIYPCHCFIGLEKFCLGSINNPGPVPRKWFESHQLIENERCEHCFARFACGGSCAYENYGVNGNIYTPTPEHCAKMKAWIELTIYLDSQMNKGDREYLLDLGLVRKGLNIFDIL